MDGFSERVRELLASHNLSVRGAAKAMSYDPAFLSRVLNGKQSPSTQLAAALDTLLGTGVQLTTLAADRLSGVAPLEVPATGATVADFLPAEDPFAPLVAKKSHRIGTGDVSDLAARVHGLRLADDVLAGNDLIRPALREFKSAIRLYREGTHTQDVGRALLSQIGELAQIVGWIASDAGRHDDAERIYRVGLSAAKQAENHTLSGNLAGSLAYQMSNTGRESEGLTLAQAALSEAGSEAPPKARALYLDRVAWAHTKMGESRLAMQALGEASEALSEDSADSEAPAYLYWVDMGELQVMESRVYTEIRRPLRAVPLLRDVLSRYDATHTRELALYLSWLAVALTDANEPEEAAVVAGRIITMDVASERTADRLRVVLSRLRDYADVPEVASVLAHRAA